jgi:iron complex outermembrane receptor protein
VREVLNKLLRNTNLSAELTESGVVTVSPRKERGSSEMDGKTRSALLGSVVMLPGLMSAAPAAHAQPAAVSSAAQTSSVEEVIVTARRRAENIENVPASIQVLSATALVERGIHNEQDLQTAVPGLLVRTNNNQFQLNYVMRGESFEPYSGSVPGVQPYVDEVALSGNTPPPFYDLENVQVLKGPQGTLFGRNSTGGAVLYTTAQPRQEFGGYVSAEYGRFNRFISEGGINIPISEQVQLRVAGTYQSGGAFVHNIYNNTDEGDSKVRSGRATLVLKPNNEFSNTTMVQHTDIDATNVGKFITYVAPCGVGASNPCWETPSNAFFQKFIHSAPGTYSPGWPAGFIPNVGVADLPGYLKSIGKYVIDSDSTGVNNAKDTIAINTSTLELAPWATVKNIFGYSKTQRRSQTDNDNTPYPLLQTGPAGMMEHRDTRQISDEVQIQGSLMDNRLTYIVGGFYSNNRAEYDSPLTGFTYVIAANLPVSFTLRYRALTVDRSAALFTQETFAVTDKLNITAGVRYTHDKLSIRHLQGSAFYGSPEQATVEKHPSWTVSVDYRFTPELLGYVTSRSGWRVGGYNPFVPTGTGNRVTAAAGGDYFPEEKVNDLEAGAKFAGTLAGMPVRLNADAYYVWAKNIEKTGTTIVAGRVTSATLSIPRGEVFGLEADGDVRPIEWLDLGGTFSYTFGKYTSNKANIFGQNVVFDTFPDTPMYSGTVYANITQPLAGKAGTLKYHADIYGQSSFHITSLGNSFIPGDRLPGYTLVNLRIDWQEPMGAKGITASAFLKNAFDKYYYTGGGGGVQANGTNSGNFGLPRTYGVVLRADF